MYFNRGYNAGQNKKSRIYDTSDLSIYLSISFAKSITNSHVICARVWSVRERAWNQRDWPGAREEWSRPLSYLRSHLSRSWPVLLISWPLSPGRGVIGGARESDLCKRSVRIHGLSRLGGVIGLSHTWPLSLQASLADFTASLTSLARELHGLSRTDRERGRVRERPCSLIGWDRSHE